MEDAARTALELRMAVGRLHRRLRAVGNAESLSASQISVLTRIAKGEADTAAALAALEGVRPQSMAATVAALESLALVERTPDPDDGRRALLRLTRAGRERYEGDRAVRQEWLTRALETRLDDAERATLAAAARLIQRIAEP